VNVKKSKKLISLVCVLLSAALTFGGCDHGGGSSSSESAAQGNTTIDENAESWAYIHESTKEILRLGSDGRAIFHGNAYDYSRDGDFLILKDADGTETKMRFIEKREGQMLLYERTEYHYAGSSQPNGIIGFWQGGPEDRLSYEFTAKGTYLEDGTWPGHFTEDQENGTIKLMYNDHFEDAYLYYELKDGKLIIDYPWPMVRTESPAEGK
jgi:hypothetical protein